MGQCDYAIMMGKDHYVKGRKAYALLHEYTQIQEVPDCVKKYAYPEYWDLMRDDASTLTALLAIIASLLLLL